MIRSLADAISIMPVAEHSIERVVLGRLRAPRPLEIAGGQEHGEQRREQHDGLDEHCEPVDRDHACDRLVRPVVVDDDPLDEHEDARRRGRRRTRRAARPRRPAVVVAEQRAAEHDHERGARTARAAARSRTSRSTESRSISSTRCRVGGSLVAPPRPLPPRPSSLDRGLLVVAAVLDVLDEDLVDAGLDAVEHRLRVEAEEQREAEQRHDRARSRAA